MQPSLSYNKMIVASKSFLYIHNSQSSRMRAKLGKVKRACLRSVNQLPALSQSRPRVRQRVQRAISQASAFQYSSSLGMLSSYSFASLFIWYGSTQGIPLIRSGSFRRGGQTGTWLIAIGEMNQFESICLSWFNSGNVLNSSCQSQCSYTLSIGFVVFTWSKCIGCLPGQFKDFIDRVFMSCLDDHYWQWDQKSKDLSFDSAMWKWKDVKFIPQSFAV